MDSDISQAESLAAMHVLTALIRALRAKGALTSSEVDHLLERAGFPLQHSDELRAGPAAGLVTEMRASVRSD